MAGSGTLVRRPRATEEDSGAEPRHHVLASWLGRPPPNSSQAAEPDPETVAAQDTDSPLELHRPLFRGAAGRDTIMRISPEKRSQIEAIDSDPDDHEFDDRAHWHRRKRLRKKAAAIANQPSIMQFCIPKDKTTTPADSEVAKQDDTAMEIELTVEEPAKESKRKAKAQKQPVKEESVVASPTTVADAPKDEANAVMSDSIVIVATESPPATAKAPATALELLMSSGRPKRKAVVNSEERAAGMLTPPAAKRSLPLVTDLTTPTPPPASASKARSKRKLDSGKKKSGAAATGATATAAGASSQNAAKNSGLFFLSEQERKQLQEMEAVTLFREQLRQQREKEREFFNGREAVNPFFQAPSKREPPASVIDVESGEEVMLSPSPEQGSKPSRWSKKPLPMFPAVQHVCSIEIDEEIEAETQGKLSVPTFGSTLANVKPLSSNWESSEIDRARLICHMEESSYQVDAEATCDDLFWLRLCSQNTACGRMDMARTALDYGSEGELIEDLVDRYGGKEHRVRELLELLELAKEKRISKEANLSFVDRYAPVKGGGLVGNKETVRLLSSWLSAWKAGGDERERRSCFQSELFVFEGDNSDTEDEVDLCRLFILQGDSGSGKSASVYACAEELGYEVIEINAAQNRSGRHIVEIAGEATQSTRVLHTGDKAGAKKKKSTPKKSSKKRQRMSSDGKPIASHLSLVLFEDIDIVFEEDKGFLTSLCTIAKRSKCPIVATCRELPDSFPAQPARLQGNLSKPSRTDFVLWMMLVAHLENLPLSHGLLHGLADFFSCDIRHSLHFVQANLAHWANPSPPVAQWRWHAASTPAEEAKAQEAAARRSVPAWSRWPLRSFDMMTSNLLSELSTSESALVAEEDKSREEKLADGAFMSDLSAVMDAVSMADLWTKQADQEETCFQQAAYERLALDLRVTSLASLVPSATKSSRIGCNADIFPMRCAQRAQDAAQADLKRNERRLKLAQLKETFELPLPTKGSGGTDLPYVLDYLPMVTRILNSSGSQQESRRRTSRRNHYLRDVLSDMTIVDELQDFNTFVQQDTDQIVAASPMTSQ